MTNYVLMKISYVSSFLDYLIEEFADSFIDNMRKINRCIVAYDMVWLICGMTLGISNKYIKFFLYIKIINGFL